VYPISRHIKALKNFKPNGNRYLGDFQARNMLGKNIRDEKGQGGDTGDERNKVDVRRCGGRVAGPEKKVKRERLPRTDLSCQC
jgi:hypothetical protein